MKFRLIENINNYINSLKNIQYYRGIDLLEAHSLSKDIENNILKTLEDSGRIDIRGQKITTFEDLATLCKIFRDTHTECFRVLFIKNNVVVGGRGVASKISDAVQIIPYHNDNDTLGKALIDYKNTMERTNADSYYLVHNHTDGKVTPSQEDFAVTNFFRQNILGYKGHLIVGKNNYNFIEPNGTMIKKRFDNTNYDTVKNDHLNSVDSIIQYLNHPQIDAKNSIYIIYVDSKYNVIALEELSTKAFNDKYIMNYIKNRKNDLGSSGVYLYTEDKNLFYDKIALPFLPNYIFDILLNDNNKILSKRELSNKVYSIDDIERLKRFNL